MSVGTPGLAFEHSIAEELNAAPKKKLSATRGVDIYAPSALPPQHHRPSRPPHLHAE